jgi:hypothetical protein
MSTRNNIPEQSAPVTINGMTLEQHSMKQIQEQLKKQQQNEG